jgi:hypothetical protein
MRQKAFVCVLDEAAGRAAPVEVQGEQILEPTTIVELV